MSSRNYSSQQSIDYLIADSLRAQVGDAEPSPGVWKRTRRQALKRAFLAQPQSIWNWDAIFSPAPVPASQSGAVALRSDMLLLRFWDYAGMLLRFGW